MNMLSISMLQVKSEFIEIPLMLRMLRNAEVKNVSNKNIYYINIQWINGSLDFSFLYCKKSKFSEYISQGEALMMTQQRFWENVLKHVFKLIFEVTYNRGHISMGVVVAITPLPLKVVGASTYTIWIVFISSNTFKNKL